MSRLGVKGREKEEEGGGDTDRRPGRGENTRLTFFDLDFHRPPLANGLL